MIGRYDTMNYEVDNYIGICEHGKVIYKRVEDFEAYSMYASSKDYTNEEYRCTCDVCKDGSSVMKWHKLGRW